MAKTGRPLKYGTEHLKNFNFRILPSQRQALRVLSSKGISVSDHLRKAITDLIKISGGECLRCGKYFVRSEPNARLCSECNREMKRIYSHSRLLEIKKRERKEED